MKNMYATDYTSLKINISEFKMVFFESNFVF